MPLKATLAPRGAHSLQALRVDLKEASPNPSEGGEKEPECAVLSFEIVFIIKSLNVPNLHYQKSPLGGDLEGLGLFSHKLPDRAANRCVNFFSEIQHAFVSGKRFFSFVVVIAET